MAALPGLLLPFLHPAGHVGGVATQLRGLRRTSGDSGGPGGAGGQSPPPPRSQEGGGIHLRGRGLGGAGRGRGGPRGLSVLPRAGLPEPEHARPRLLAGPEGRAPRAPDPGLPVGRRSPAQLQVREGTRGEGRVRPQGQCCGRICGDGQAGPQDLAEGLNSGSLESCIPGARSS